MMATTHALYGMAVGASVLSVAPEYAPTAMVVGYVAGAVPDFDAYAEHRRTLHAPVYCTLLAVPALLLAVVSPSVLSVSLATALVALAAHAVMDAGGGGLSLRPWIDEPGRAVYSHYHGRWIPPRRLIAYDGAPGDLALALLAGLPLLAVTAGLLRGLVAATLLVSMAYVLVRKRFVEIVTLVIHLTPQRLYVLVPRRFDHLIDSE